MLVSLGRGGGSLVFGLFGGPIVSAMPGWMMLLEDNLFCMGEQVEMETYGCHSLPSEMGRMVACYSSPKVLEFLPAGSALWKLVT